MVLYSFSFLTGFFSNKLVRFPALGGCIYLSVNQTSYQPTKGTIKRLDHFINNKVISLLYVVQTTKRVLFDLSTKLFDLTFSPFVSY